MENMRHFITQTAACLYWINRWFKKKGGWIQGAPGVTHLLDYASDQQLLIFGLILKNKLESSELTSAQFPEPKEVTEDQLSARLLQRYKC